MSASLITGRPGHGKSYYGVLQVLEELRRSDRYIVTNLPLDLKELCLFCEENFPDDPNVMGRVRILQPGEAAEFWLYDVEGCIVKGMVLWEPEEKMWHKSIKPRDPIKVPDFSRRQEESYPGVLYIIDEAHIFFDAYNWQQTGSDLSYFISQHRKLRSDIMFITQHPTKLAKRLRIDLEEYTVVTNLGKVKGYSGVTLPGWFMRATYPGKPDDPDPGEPERGRFRLKAESICKLYSTAAGVGLAGRVDTQEQKRGKHWSVWVVKGCIGAVLLLVLPALALKAMGSLVNVGLGGYLGASTGMAHRVSTNAPVSMPAMPSAPAAAPVSPVPVRPAVPVVRASDDVFIVGSAPGCLMLDDGRVISARDHRWKQAAGGFAVVGPELSGFFRWKKAADAVTARRAAAGAYYDPTPIPRQGTVVRDNL